MNKKKYIQSIILGIIINPICLFLILEILNLVFYAHYSFQIINNKYPLWDYLYEKSFLSLIVFIPFIIGVGIITLKNNKTYNLSLKITLTLLSIIFFSSLFDDRVQSSKILEISFIFVIISVFINDFFKNKLRKPLLIIFSLFISVFILDSINTRLFLGSLKKIESQIIDSSYTIRTNTFEEIKKINLHYSFYFAQDTVEIDKNNYKSYYPVLNKNIVENIEGNLTEDKYYAIWNMLNVKFYPINKSSEIMNHLNTFLYFERIWSNYFYLSVYPDFIYTVPDGTNDFIKVENDIKKI